MDVRLIHAVEPRSSAALSPPRRENSPMKSRIEPLNCGSRRESALTVLQIQIERTHVRCYQVHGEGRVTGEVASLLEQAPLRMTVLCACALTVIMLTACNGLPTREERQAARNFQEVSQSFRPENQRPVQSMPPTNASLSAWMQFAILNQPQVEAAYDDWAASVQRITVERSLPDPRLTFQADIADTVMSLMPGLMLDILGPGKLQAAASVASAESAMKYFAFESSLLQAAFALKKAYYELYFLDAKIGVERQTLRLLADLEVVARARNEVGKVTLQDVLWAQIERERLTTEVANLEDSRQARLAEYKAALGLRPDESNPLVLPPFESTGLDLTAEQLFATALARNPRLRVLEAEVRRAEALLRLADTARRPDFNVGIEANAKASPVIFNPQFGVTLPLWRDKIAAQLAEAQAGQRASEARLTAEQVSLAVEFAEQSFVFRESSRNLALLQERLLPKARQSLELGRAIYLSGQLDFLGLMNAQRTLLEFELAEVEARAQRELALAEISLLILGVPPVGAPVLSQPVSSLYLQRVAGP